MALISKLLTSLFIKKSGQKPCKLYSNNMKLIVQIPCLNEEKTLNDVISTIPKKIDGIDVIETLIIDDGSSDNTVAVAKEIGVTHIVRNKHNLGLARSFTKGLDACLARGADIVVNTDGDNQYPSDEIPNIVKPIIDGQADIVVGHRGGMDNPHFPYFKRKLQVWGSRVISWIIGTHVPDAVSGFRAISRDAAEQINILTTFSYTIEMLVQAAHKNIVIKSVTINTNAKTRESRLFKSIPYFIKMSGMTFLRVYTMYKPLKVFLYLGMAIMLLGALPVLRFLYFFLNDGGGGHVQSLIIGGTLFSLGFFTVILGIIADLISFNRKLTEKLLYRIQILEEKIERNDP